MKFEMPKIDFISYKVIEDIAGTVGPGGGNQGISGIEGDD